MRSVIDILRSRGAQEPGTPRDDGARVALAVEGGAMRGVISAGMVSALEDLDLLHAFDGVFGSSAGAINAAYFVAGQANLGTTIYYEDINNRRFIDLARPLVGRPIVDLDFLLGDVAVRRKRLDVQRILTSPVPLSVLATDVGTEAARVFGKFATAESLLGALRSSATMPIIAGGPHAHENGAYFDASIVEPVPVPAAEAAGFTHILVLLTRGSGVRPHPSALDRYFVAPRLRRISPTLAARYLDRARPYSILMQSIDRGTGPLGRAAVEGIRVTDLHVSRLERRPAVLADGAKRGYAAVMAAFGR